MDNQQYIQTLCTNILALRHRGGFSQEEMTERFGISADMQSKLEEGILPEELTVEMLVGLEQKFGVSLKEMFLPL